MTTLVVETRISAPIESCFDLARDVAAHVKTASSVLADKLFVERHMRNFMVKKQSALKEYAEHVSRL